VNNTLLATLPLFIQAESTKSTKLLLPLCALFLMPDLAVGREVESCCKPMTTKEREEKRCHQVNYVCPSLPSQYLLLRTREARVWERG